MKTYIHGSKSYKGVYGPPSWGWALGVIEVCNVATAGAVKTTKAEDSRSALRKDQLSVTWHHLQQRSHVASSHATKAGTTELDLDGALRISPPAATQRKKGDECALDDLWDGPVPVCDEAPAAAATTGQTGQPGRNEALRAAPRPAKRGRASGAPGASLGIAADGGNGGNSNISLGPAGSEVQLLKHRKEIDITETQVVGARHVLSSLEDAAACLIVTPKCLTDLLTKLSARLQPKLIDIYSTGYDAMKPETADTRGMRLWSELQEIKTKLESCKLLIEHQQATSNSSGLDIIAARTVAIEAGIKIPSAVVELAFNRDALHLFDLKLYREWAAVLNAETLHECLEVDSGTPGKAKAVLKCMTLKNVPEELQADLQARTILKGLTTIMRPEKNLEATKTVVAALSEISILSEPLKAEFDSFQKLLWPWRDPSSVKDVKASFLANTQLLLHRSLKYFGTGIEICVSVDGVVQQVARDACLLKELDSICDAVNRFSFDILTLPTSAGKPVIQSASRAAINKLFEQYMFVETGSSERFKDL